MLRSTLTFALFSIAIVLFATASDAVPCPLDVKQRQVSTYVEDGRFTTMWEVEMTAGKNPITAVRLSLTPPAPYNPIVQVKNMESAGPVSSISSSPSSASVHSFRLPATRTSRGGIFPHKTHTFEYVVRGMAPASISLVSVSCMAGSAEAQQEGTSSSALPFYIGPLSSFFGGKNAEQTTPKEQEQRSCSVKVEQLARSLEKGGSWFDNEYMYRTYDLNVTNIGTKAFAWSLIEIELQPQEELYEWWNTVRPSATEPVLKFVANGGLEAKQTLTAGYVLRSPLSVHARAEPALKLSKVSCVGSEPQALPLVFCRSALNVTTRPESAGGRWTDGEFVYQAHDIKVINQGGRLVRDARLTITHDPEAVLTQWWEVNRVGSSNVFHLGTPIRVDTSLPAGLIERLPLRAAYSSSRIPLQVFMDSVTCV